MFWRKESNRIVVMMLLVQSHAVTIDTKPQYNNRKVFLRVNCEFYRNNAITGE